MGGMLCYRCGNPTDIICEGRDTVSVYDECIDCIKRRQKWQQRRM